jgi:hypothetical protein
MMGEPGQITISTPTHNWAIIWLKWSVWLFAFAFSWSIAIAIVLGGNPTVLEFQALVGLLSGGITGPIVIGIVTLICRAVVGQKPAKILGEQTSMIRGVLIPVVCGATTLVVLRLLLLALGTAR